MTVSALSIWGAIVSTILAIVKIWETYRDRARLVISYSFDSREEEGNKIIIYNPSNTPVMINYWELLWIRKKYWLFSEIYNGIYPDEGYCDINISAHSKHEIIFRDEHYFILKKKYIRSGLYINLHIVGKQRPVQKFIYDLSISKILKIENEKPH